MTKTMLIAPRMSEKAYQISTNSSVYVFDVPKSANKQTIAGAVKEQFNVIVIKVNVLRVKPKAKRTIVKKGRQVHRGNTSEFNKAYVTLKKGDSLPFFAAVEEAEEKQAKTQEQVTKAIEKQAAKEAAPARRGLHLPGRRSGPRGGNK